MPGCSSSSKFKGNIICHVKDDFHQLKRKEKKCDNKKMLFLWKTFAQKSNRDRHIHSQHTCKVSGGTIPTFISDLESQPGPSSQRH